MTANRRGKRGGRYVCPVLHESLLAVMRRLVAVSVAEEEVVRQLFVSERLAKNDYLLRPGEVSRKVAFIEQGVLHNFQSRDGHEATYYFSREGEFIGDYPSFLPAVPALNGIQALEEARLLTITYDNLQGLYRELREGERFGRLVAESLFVDALSQLTSFYKDAPQQRYERFLALYPDLQQRVPQYYIASYVGVRPQSLSRIRGRH